jgi:hypothetical protein
MTTDLILAALRAAPDGLTRSELFAAGSNKWSAADLTAVLEQLEARGDVRRERTQPRRGRPIERWRLISPTGSNSISVESQPRDWMAFYARWRDAQNRKRRQLGGRP